MNALTLALSAIVLIPRRPGMLAERAQVREGAKAWDRFLAAAIVVVARRELSHHGQPTDPGFPTSHVVPTGVFFVSRNPIYLGAACLLIGIALAVNLPWVFVLLLPALVGCHYIPIAPEERHLAVKLGEEYLTYAVSVHPWVGRARRPR